MNQPSADEESSEKSSVTMSAAVQKTTAVTGVSGPELSPGVSPEGEPDRREIVKFSAHYLP